MGSKVVDPRVGITFFPLNFVSPTSRNTWVTCRVTYRWKITHNLYDHWIDEYVVVRNLPFSG